MKTNVYVDGFNLYYGCLKDTPYRWLDISALCRNVFPKNQINRIRYFTARVRATVNDPQKPQRQNMILRALQTIPNLSIHYGQFLSHPAQMRLAHPLPNGPKTVEVIKTREKGSDVNLATYLLVDAFDGDYEVAIIISNDSDLVEPIKVVRYKLGLKVGILNPQIGKRTSWALRNVATFYRNIREGVLRDSQFPPILTDEKGTFRKPSQW